MPASPLSSNHRRRNPSSGLVFQLFFLLVLPISILLLIVAFGSITVHQEAMRILVGERDERALRALVRILDDNVAARTAAVASLALLAAENPPEDYPTVLSASAALFPELDGGLALLDAQGQLLGVQGERQVWEELGLKARQDLLLTAREQGQASRLVSLKPGSWMFLVLAALPQEGPPVFAGGVFSVSELADRAVDGVLDSGKPAYLFLVDEDRNLIYQMGSLGIPDPVENHPGVVEALRGETGTIYQGHEGMEKVVVYGPVSTAGWALVMEEPWAEATSPLLRTTIFTPLVLVPALLLSVAALGFAARQIVQPLLALAAKTDRLAWGEFPQIEESVGGILEIRHLQKGLIHLAHKVQSAQRNLHSYIAAITSAQEDERRRVARELHDDTIQALIALKQRVQLLQMDAAENSAAASLGELESLTEQAVVNLRRIIRDLRPIYLEDLGLAAALEMLAGEVQKQTGVRVQYQVRGAEIRLPGEVELGLYRIVQEALSNVARHARASKVEVRVSFLLDRLLVEVIDDGAGFVVPPTPADLAPEGHYGLLGIFERAELLGGVLQLDSSPGQGTRLSIQLTLPRG